jgi:hypothetical protein
MQLNWPNMTPGIGKHPGGHKRSSAQVCTRRTGNINQPAKVMDSPFSIDNIPFGIFSTESNVHNGLKDMLICSLLHAPERHSVTRSLTCLNSTNKERSAISQASREMSSIKYVHTSTANRSHISMILPLSRLRLAPKSVSESSLFYVLQDNSQRSSAKRHHCQQQPCIFQ